MPGLLDPPKKRVTYRAGLLPYAEYDDGSAGFDTPQSLLDLKHSAGKMGRALQSAFGARFAPQDVIPDQSDAGLAGLAMTGGIAVPKPVGSLGIFGGKFPEGVTAERVLNPHSEGALYDYNLKHNGRGIGQAMVADDGKNLTVHEIDVDKKYQGQGIGTALYGQIENDFGRKLEPSNMLLEPGYQFWKKHYPDKVADYVWDEANKAYVPNPKSRWTDDLGDLDSLDNNTLFSNPKEAGPFGWLAGMFNRDKSGNALADVAASNGLRSSPVEAGSGSVRAYRGVMTDKPELSGERPMMFASASPDVANTYANQGAVPFENGAVTPVDMRFNNALTVDAGGRPFWGIPHNGESLSTENIAKLAKSAGHDGLIVKNVLDAIDQGSSRAPADTYVALHPGTVRSATTGETLFSNPPEAAAAGTVGMAPQQRGLLGGSPTRAGLLDAMPNQGGSEQPSPSQAAIAQLNGLLADRTRNAGNIDAVVQRPNQGHAPQQFPGLLARQQIADAALFPQQFPLPNYDQKLPKDRRDEPWLQPGYQLNGSRGVGHPVGGLIGPRFDPWAPTFDLLGPNNR